MVVFLNSAIAVKAEERIGEERREGESPSMMIFHVCDMLVMTGILNG